MTIRQTSIAAKQSIAGSAKNLRSLVFRFILAERDDGATLNEIASGLDIPLQTVCARRHELGEQGLVIDSGKRRKTPSNRSAIVWVVPGRIAAAAKKRGF